MTVRGTKKVYKTGPIFPDHDTREQAIRLVSRMLLEGATTPAIQASIMAGLSKKLERPIKVSRRTIQSLILISQGRARKEFNEDPSVHAAEQVGLLREVQKSALQSGAPQAISNLIRASRQLSRLLGLDSPVEMRHVIEEAEGLKASILAALQKVTKDPDLLRRVSEELSGVGAVRKSGVVVPIQSEDLVDVEEDDD